MTFTVTHMVLKKYKEKPVEVIVHVWLIWKQDFTDHFKNQQSNAKRSREKKIILYFGLFSLLLKQRFIIS